MSDSTSTSRSNLNGTSDAPTFAPIPSWERGKTRRGIGSRIAPKPRRAAPTDAVDKSNADFVDAPSGAFAMAPAFATRTSERSNSTAPMAILAGVIVVAGVAAAGWYYSHANTETVVARTPSTAAASDIAASGSIPAPTEPAVQAAVQAPVAPAPKPTFQAKATHSPAPARTAGARAASDRSSNAAAIIAAPTTPTAAAPPVVVPSPAPLVLSIPQTAPTSTAPAENPIVPQVAPTQPPPT